MVEVRLMIESDIPDVLSVWTDVGFSEGTHSIETFFEVDPKGFYVAVENGRIVATCAAIIHNENLATIGLYAVRPSHQGKGIGLETWKIALEHVKDINCYLNAVPERFHTYNKKAGFGLVDNYKINVWTKNAVSLEKLVENVEGVEIKTVTPEIAKRIIAYDEEIAGYNRATLVNNTVKEKDCVSLVATKDDNICGYGCLRKENLGGTLLGPLYADAPDVAELLMRKLMHSFPTSEQGGLTFMGIDANPFSSELAQKLGLEIAITSHRLYTKQTLDAKYEKIYNVTNCNFCNV